MADGILKLNEMFGLDDLIEIEELDIKSLVTRKDHKWQHMSEDKIKLMDQSIRDMGILQPIIVRPKEDIPYEIEGLYEILVGNTRTERAKVVGLEKIPAIVKRGLTEEEAAVYVNYSNIQRDWRDMSYSARAAVIADAYHIQEKRGTKDTLIDEINNLIKMAANPVESRDEHAECPGVTSNKKEVVAEDYDLSPRTIMRYIRIDVLADDVKSLLDMGQLPFKAAVQISYLTEENQKMFAELMQSENNFKCNEEKAKQLRVLEENKKLTIASMTEVLIGVKKKAGKPKDHKISYKVISEFFTNGETKKEIDDVIIKALKQYFAQ